MQWPGSFDKASWLLGQLSRSTAPDALSQAHLGSSALFWFFSLKLATLKKLEICYQDLRYAQQNKQHEYHCGAMVRVAVFLAFAFEMCFHWLLPVSFSTKYSYFANFLRILNIWLMASDDCVGCVLLDWVHIWEGKVRYHYMSI